MELNDLVQKNILDEYLVQGVKVKVKRKESEITFSKEGIKITLQIFAKGITKAQEGTIEGRLNVEFLPQIINNKMLLSTIEKNSTVLKADLEILGMDIACVRKLFSGILEDRFIPKVSEKIKVIIEESFYNGLNKLIKKCSEPIEIDKSENLYLVCKPTIMKYNNLFRQENFCRFHLRLNGTLNLHFNEKPSYKGNLEIPKFVQDELINNICSIVGFISVKNKDLSKEFSEELIPKINSKISKYSLLQANSLSLFGTNTGITLKINIGFKPNIFLLPCCNWNLYYEGKPIIDSKTKLLKIESTRFYTHKKYPILDLWLWLWLCNNEDKFLLHDMNDKMTNIDKDLCKLIDKKIEMINSKINGNGVEIEKGVFLVGNLDTAILSNLVIDKSNLNINVLLTSTISVRILDYASNN